MYHKSTMLIELIDVKEKQLLFSEKKTTPSRTFGLVQFLSKDKSFKTVPKESLYENSIPLQTLQNRCTTNNVLSVLEFPSVGDEFEYLKIKIKLLLRRFFDIL